MGVYGGRVEVAKTQGLSTHLIAHLNEDPLLGQQISNHLHNWFSTIYFGLSLASKTLSAH
jgi:hypothetical protein